jgi:NADH-ubiquinone oxidoreductase chain 1
MIFINVILFWQISALDLESINVKFYLQVIYFGSFFLVVVFLLLMIFVMIGVAFLTLLERKVLGYVNICKGPNKVGFVGILQPFRDAIELFTKEQYFPLQMQTEGGLLFRGPFCIIMF